MNNYIKFGAMFFGTVLFLLGTIISVPHLIETVPHISYPGMIIACLGGIGLGYGLAKKYQ